MYLFIYVGMKVRKKFCAVILTISPTLFQGTYLINVDPFTVPANTRRSPNVGSLLGQRRRRCANIESTLSEGLVFVGQRFNLKNTYTKYLSLNNSHDINAHFLLSFLPSFHF